jgi:hypothetical protein
MMFDAADDVRNHLVSALPRLTPGRVHADRVRALCLAQLERAHRRSRRLNVITRFGRHVVAPAIAGGLFALYAADLVVTTLRTLTA